jgi:hypothetical protein
LILILLFIISCTCKIQAQWQTPQNLSDMNNWSSNAGFINWYNHTNNVPNGQGYGSGVQFSLGPDPRFGAQIVIPTFDQNIYFRRYLNGSWDNWLTIWTSANINKNDVDFNAKNVNCTNLFANGNIWGKEIIVALSNPWPDYVFKVDYKNGHLPEIPSAKDVEENGINIGEMQVKLLQKVEELTLYAIEQEKSKKQLEQKLIDYENKYNVLIKKIEELNNKVEQK